MSASSPSPRLWLIAGTGEGPVLARALLAMGWRLQVSVVTPAAAGAYPSVPGLELQVGSLGGIAGEGSDGAVAVVLAQAECQGDPFAVVVDASHPFAVRISGSLQRVCAERGQPLLRLQRPPLDSSGAELLEDLQGLRDWVVPGSRLLLAIGARRLAEAIAATPGALHHARILPNAEALQQARAAGLADRRLACLRPGGPVQGIERALCLRWRIDTVVCRQSGGASESLWQELSDELGLRLLLLRRPDEPLGITALTVEALLARLAWELGVLAAAATGVSPDGQPPAP